MIALDDYEDIKRCVEAARQRADRAAGALALLKKQLKAGYGCETIKDARALYNKMLAEEHTASETWNRSFAAFKKKWAKELELPNG